jgi:hypothetical protein
MTHCRRANLSKPVLAFVFGESGLMADASRFLR